MPHVSASEEGWSIDRMHRSTVSLLREPGELEGVPCYGRGRPRKRAIAASSGERGPKSKPQSSGCARWS